jgi:hypothetical protein
VLQKCRKLSNRHVAAEKLTKDVISAWPDAFDMRLWAQTGRTDATMNSTRSANTSSLKIILYN